jgi:hypothetical protein
MVVTLGGVVLVGAGLLLMHRFTSRDGLRRKASTIGGLAGGAACIVVGAFVIVLGLR